MTTLLSQPLLFYQDANGKPLPGALCNVYLSGSSTPAIVYRDAALQNPFPNPIPALTNGYFPAIYVPDDVTLKIVLTDASGANPLPAIDPVASTVLTQAQVGAALNPITDAEISAALVPLDYSRVASPWKDISRFVDDNTGLVDVTNQFRNALKAEKSIIIPDGTYLISSEITVPDGVYIEGTGKTRSILKFRGAPASSACLRWVDVPTQDVVLRDFGIDLRTTQGNAYKCLHFSEVRPFLIENMYFIGASTATDGNEDTTLILFDGNGTYTGQGEISNCLLNNTKYGIVQHGKGTTINILNNIFINGETITPGSVAIVMDGTLTAGAMIVGNQIERQDIGIYLGNATAQVRQIANYFEANATYDFQWAALSTNHMSVGDINTGTALASFSYDNAHAHTVLGGSYGFFADSQVLNAYRGFTELGLPVAIGYGTTPAFAAGNFTSNVGSWTVIGAGVTTYTFSRKGGEMTVAFSVSGTAAGTPVSLNIAIPGGFFPAVNITNPIMVTNGGTRTFGFAQVTTSAAVINCYRDATGSAAWTNGAVVVEGEITFRIIS